MENRVVENHIQGTAFKEYASESAAVNTSCSCMATHSRPCLRRDTLKLMYITDTRILQSDLLIRPYVLSKINSQGTNGCCLLKLVT